MIICFIVEYVVSAVSAVLKIDYGVRICRGKSHFLR